MQLPYLIIELDKPRKLQLPISVALEFESVTKKKLTGLDVSRMDNTIDLLWLMLRKEDSKLTRQKTIEIVDESGISIDDLQEAVYTMTHVAFTGKAPKGSKQGKNLQTPTADEKENS